jgi:signal peptidase II
MRIFFWAGFAAFLIDQISKYIVIHMLELSRIRSIDVLPPLVNFRYGENRGINFGFLGDAPDAARWVLIALALVICSGVMIWLYRSAAGRLALLCGGLLVGGALANVVDRLIYGYVLLRHQQPLCFQYRRRVYLWRCHRFDILRRGSQKAPQQRIEKT